MRPSSTRSSQVVEMPIAQLRGLAFDPAHAGENLAPRDLDGDPRESRLAAAALARFYLHREHAAAARVRG